jgi:L-threonylcarbamoyladenylate synthase
MRTKRTDAQPGETQVLLASDAGALAAAAEMLRRGGLVAFPTETVYGLGALGLDAEAVERIFGAKGRPHSDPLILHVAGPEMVPPLVGELPAAAEGLMAAFWPGPLTLVLPKSAAVPDRVTASLDSVAVRMPDHPVALDLIRRVGAPLAAPSANLFGRTSPTTAQHVLQDLGGRIHAVLDAGPTRVGVESTVLDLRGEPVVLRPGGIPREELERALGRPVPLRGEQAAGEGLRSPGLLSRHYSPRAEVILLEGEEALPELVRRAEEGGRELAVLAFSEDLPALEESPAVVIELGSRDRPEEVARNLYRALREADERGVAQVAVRALPPGGLGDAVNDRLRRASRG